MIERFADPERGGFYETSSDHEQLVARRKDLEDNPIPAGNSSAAFGLLRLAALSGDIERQRADLERWTAEVPRLFLIEEEYALAVREAEAAWVRSLVAELRNGTLPGLDAWRAWHTSGGTPPEWTALMEGEDES
jgi:uncharacterized protein YyaL (SSP411 family)